ncbi:MAG: hypothetical protein Q7T86_13990 [Hyphomicrobiaceae bacterium]|nr:hypothetical protein [Hyphomicrobiaceae bacterium]
MAYVSDDGPTRGFSTRALKMDFAPAGDGPDQDRPPRDIKKLMLVIGLGALSWVATYVGMLELIEANTGDLPIVHKLIIGFSVGMLMTMIVWLLDQMFAPIGAFTRLCYMAGYLFLSIISIGFGFGFYWKVLESRSESSRSAESAVAQVQGSLHAASTRLEQLQATLVQLTDVSHQKAELERTKGTSCPNSRPGDGPRRKLREDDAARFTFASDFVKGRVTAVKSELTALDTDLARVVMQDKATFDAKTGTRNEFMKSLSRKLDMTVTGFNAFRTDPQLKQMRTDLSDRADQTTFGDPKSGGFACPDTQLQGALRGAVRAIDQLPELQKPQIAAVEGSEATIEAFRRLTATFYGALAFKMPPSADELRDLQKRAVQSAETQSAEQRAMLSEGGGLSKRDYVPLAIAIFVDICLLLVSMGRPMNRLHGLMPKMREAERGPVIQILSRFNEIHRDPQIRQNFELFRHVVFDWHGDYYVAVPLHAPVRFMPKYARMREADVDDLEHEAHLLSNLFTSFEKERIFKRVYNPLLNTRAIQKRLERQGSKFSEVDAFRIYRFRDGAWPEIILGAVMGAARRIETEKQRQSIEREIYRQREPGFMPGAPAATAPAAQAPASPAAPASWGPLQRFPTLTEFGVDTPSAVPPSQPTSRRAHVKAPEAAPPPTATQPAQPRPVPVARVVDPEPAPVEWDEPDDIEDGPYESDQDFRAKFGPYAAHMSTRGTGAQRVAKPEPEPAAQTAIVTPTATPALEPVLVDAVLKPADSPASPDKIDVIFSRETATVSMPTAEAAIQHSLAAMMRRALNRNDQGHLDRSVEEPVALLEIESLQPGRMPLARRDKLEPHET